jgi:hypothetical protein
MAKAAILNNRLLAIDGDFVEFWRAGGRSKMLELEWGGYFGYAQVREIN